MAVAEVLDDGLRYSVIRGSLGSTAEAHSQGTPVYHLSMKIFVLPFPKDFFGSPASGSYSYPIHLPDVRIAGAELTVTNMRGDSEPAQVSFTATTEFGLRTLSGGQLSIQIEGYLAIQSEVAPPLVIEEAHSVRDVFAVVRGMPAGAPIELKLRQNAETYCLLTIPEGGTISNVVNGFGRAPLEAGAQINLDIMSVAQGGAGAPGRDLTVTMRL